MFPNYSENFQLGSGSGKQRRNYKLHRAEEIANDRLAARHLSETVRASDARRITTSRKSYQLKLAPVQYRWRVASQEEKRVDRRSLIRSNRAG
jgi:hypothetical protein